MTDFAENLPTSTSAAPFFAYVGSYTETQTGHGEGLSVFQIDPSSGVWSLIQQVKDVNDPSFLILDSQSHVLYCTHESRASVSAFAIDAQTGRLSLLNSQPTGGDAPASLNLDPSGHFLIVANYTGGTLVVLPLEPDGRLGPVCQRVSPPGTSGPDPVEQAGCHPHAVTFDPQGRYLLVPDKGFDKVFIYTFDPEKGNVLPNDPSEVVGRAGSGPRHITFHPSGAWAYLINELDSTMTTFRYDQVRGTLTPIQALSTLPSDSTIYNATAEVCIDPSGRFVYGSNRGHDSIVVYAVDQATGLLSVVEWVSTQGKKPRFFTLDPAAKRLYVANQDSDSIVAFDIASDTGKLTPTGYSVQIGSPVYIVFKGGSA